MATRGTTLASEKGAAPKQKRRPAVTFELLLDLGPDWDGYGADPPSKGCIAAARDIVADLPTGVPYPEISPNSHGTITLDWGDGEKFVEVEVGTDRFSAWWDDGSGREQEIADQEALWDVLRAL